MDLCAIVISVTLFSTAHSLVQKCCPLDEGLLNENNTFKCSDNFKEFVYPLKAEIVKNFGFPDNCTGTKTCVDKTTNGKLLELLCNSKPTNSTPKLTTIHKCCPELMFYNATTKSCDSDSSASAYFLLDHKSRIYDLQIGTPTCSGALVHSEISEDFKIANGILYTESNVYDTGQFCVDSTTDGNETRSILVVCYSKEETQEICKGTGCVPKCCKIGHSYFFDVELKKPVCKPSWNQSFIPRFFDETNQTLPHPENLAILPPLVCTGRYFPASNYNLFPNGTLKSSKNYFHPHDNKYCVEQYNIPQMKLNGQKIAICFPKQEILSKEKFTYYFIGLLISIVALGATLVVYFFLPELQNLHGKIIICHVASLFAAYVFLACVKKHSTQFNNLICIGLGYGVTFTFLSAFSWLNVMCFDIWWTFGVIKIRDLKKNNDRKKFIYYCIYAFGLALFLTGATVFAEISDLVPKDYKPLIAEEACWLKPERRGSNFAYTIYFSGPVGLLIFCNLIFFILTARHCLKTRAEIIRMRLKDSSKKRRFLADKATLIMNLKLFIVMGITWLFEFMSSYLKEPEVLWIILDTFNMLQGLWIFIIFVFKDKVWKALKNKVGYNKLNQHHSQTQTTSASINNSTEMNTIRNVKMDAERQRLSSIT